MFLRHLFVFFIIFSFSSTSYCHALNCKNEQGKNVDWFILYKIPRMHKEPVPLSSGQAYAYLTSINFEKWTLSKYLMGDVNSILGQTLQPLYANTKNYTYALYNDEHPVIKNDNKLDSDLNAHAKGILSMDEHSGIWVVHSVPKFPPPFDQKYSYPANAETYGQTVLCITFSTEQDSYMLVNQLLVARPSLYAYGESDEVSVLNFDQLVNHHWSDDLQNVVQFNSTSSKIFYSLVKSPIKHIEIYAQEVAPSLKSNLLVETWRQGSGGPLSSDCKNNFSVNNVMKVQLQLDTKTVLTSLPPIEVSFVDKIINFFGRLFGGKEALPNAIQAGSVSWQFHEDHSKWAISNDQSKPFICIGDLNRMRSQQNRGGGTVCFEHDQVWSNYRKSIVDIEACQNNTSS